ncbi:MAG: hypothetical protein IPI81_00715 [Flavobacteriales bacterium]|nr:hypothetical protein [Flavobacteriales bacterium]
MGNEDLEIRNAQGQIIQWKSYLLTGHPDRRRGLVFSHDGKAYSGCVKLVDGEYDPVVDGWIQNGSMSGEWKAVDKWQDAITNYRLRQDLPGSDVVSVFLTRHGKLATALERLNDTLALIRSWNADPYYLLREVLAGHPTQSGGLVHWAQEYFPDGSFRRYTYRDSVDIEWIREDKEWNVPGGGCYGGLKSRCVTIVNGRGEQCLDFLNQWDSNKYMGHDYHGHYYPLGTFVHFDVYGKPDTIRLELEQSKLKPHALASLQPLK